MKFWNRKSLRELEDDFRRKSVRLREGLFLHGELEVDIVEAKDLPDTDNFMFNIKHCFGQEKDVTDPYVAVSLDHTRIITTSVSTTAFFFMFLSTVWENCGSLMSSVRLQVLGQKSRQVSESHQMRFSEFFLGTSFFPRDVGVFFRMNRTADKQRCEKQDIIQLLDGNSNELHWNFLKNTMFVGYIQFLLRPFCNSQ